MVNKKPKNGAVSANRRSGGNILKTIRSESWNRRQLAKMVKLGGVFVSQASA